MARRRQLRPEEKEIWDQVARTLRPMHSAPKAPLPDPAPAPTPRPVEPPMPLPEFRIAPRSNGKKITLDLQPTISQAIAAQPLRMDAGTHKAMKRGKMAPEARLDLHGLTLAEAHPELIRFVLNAHADGMRLVLVITGKGKDRDTGGPIPTRLGALRHQVPRWLQLPPLGPAVLQVTEAHLKHGGMGAYYVYLRRTR